MDGSAFVIGATGQAGHAAVTSLAAAGWRVRAGARRPAPPDHWPAELGVEVLVVDRRDTDALAAALSPGCDVVVDCAAYTAEHGRQLVGLSDWIGSVVVISSVSVYADRAGNSFHSPHHWPDLPFGLTEEQPTVAPSDANYGSRKVALERTLLDSGRFPVTVLRPGAVYGPYSHYPREWFFVKRAMDRRPYRILARGGRSRFHTTAAVNLAELIRLAAARPGTRILNAGDAEALTAREIGAVLFAALDHEAEEFLIEGDPPQGSVGDTPWSVQRSIVMDTSAAGRELGYQPLTDYAGAVRDAVDWMVAATREDDWEDVFAYFYANQGDQAFDYSAEDRWVAAHR